MPGGLPRSCEGFLETHTDEAGVGVALSLELLQSCNRLFEIASGDVAVEFNQQLGQRFP